MPILGVGFEFDIAMLVTDDLATGGKSDVGSLEISGNK